MSYSPKNDSKRLALVVDNTTPANQRSPRESHHLAIRRREDREIKDEFLDLPLYGPSPNRMPWEFLRAA